MSNDHRILAPAVVLCAPFNLITCHIHPDHLPLLISPILLYPFPKITLGFFALFWLTFRHSAAPEWAYMSVDSDTQAERATEATVDGPGPDATPAQDRADLDTDFDSSYNPYTNETRCVRCASPWPFPACLCEWLVQFEGYGPMSDLEGHCECFCKEDGRNGNGKSFKLRVKTSLSNPELICGIHIMRTHRRAERR